MQTLVLRYTFFPIEGGAGRVELVPTLVLNAGPARPLAAYPQLTNAARLNDCVRELLAGMERVRAGYIGPGRGTLATADLEEKVRPWARELTALLLPPKLIELLRDPVVTHVMFECDPLLNHIPFEACLLDDEYLGFSHATGKRLITAHHQPAVRTRKPVAGMPASGCGIINPGGDLAPEIDNIYWLFKTEWQDCGWDRRLDFCREVPRLPSPPQVAEALRSHDMVTLLCHHSPGDPRSGGGGFLLSPEHSQPEFRFTAKDLLQAFAPQDCVPRILFSIACFSGLTEGWERVWPRTPSVLHGMVDAILRVGIPHYIGTYLRVPGVDSARLVAPFYHAVVQGQSVGEALRLARRALRDAAGDWKDAATVIGLSFGLYGDPTVAYFCAGGHAQHPPAILRCESIEADGRPCGRAVCNADPGFTRRRCVFHAPPPPPPPSRCSAGHSPIRADLLQPCRHRDCRNTTCPECPGHGKSWCWQHACHAGHEIIADIRDRCADPAQRHPGEKRSVCPLDPGWLMHLCAECWAERQAALRGARPSASFLQGVPLG